jgi:hypothetical protein
MFEGGSSGSPPEILQVLSEVMGTERDQMRVLVRKSAVVAENRPTGAGTTVSEVTAGCRRADSAA